MSKQLLRSGTPVGAMVRESQNAESKMNLCTAITQKECDETLYWLGLTQASDYLNEQKFQGCYQQASEVLKILKA